MRRINYTSPGYETIVLEVPCVDDRDCIPPPQIVIHRRGDDGVVVPVVYHHRGDRPIHSGSDILAAL
jgi:hypothetical protein